MIPRPGSRAAAVRHTEGPGMAPWAFVISVSLNRIEGATTRAHHECTTAPARARRVTSA
jgi:hypothetical protein